MKNLGRRFAAGSLVLGLMLAGVMTAIGDEAQPGTSAPASAGGGVPAGDASASPGVAGSISGRVFYAGRVARSWEAPETVWTPPADSLASEPDPSAAPSPPPIQVTKDGGVRDVAVWLESDAAEKALRGMDLPTVEIDQKGSVFWPQMVVMPRGGHLILRNSDGINHNVHLLSHRQEKNFLLRSKDERDVQLNHDDEIRVTCDLHAWMRSSLIVVESPYYAVTDADGRFRIEGVAPGKYMIRIAHHRFASDPGDVEVEIRAGEDTTADLATKLGRWDY